MTVFWPLMMTGAGKTLVQSARETRFVVDCKVKLVKLVGQVRMTFAPAGAMVSCAGSEMLNIVPLPELPPGLAARYRGCPKMNPPNLSPEETEELRGVRGWNCHRLVGAVIGDTGRIREPAYRRGQRAGLL